MPRRKKVTRRKKVLPGSAGLAPKEISGSVSKQSQEAAAAVEANGGTVLGSYRDPFGGHDLILAALPIERVEPTAYQRDASDTHVKRLMTAIEKIGSFLDPIIAIPHADGYWTPNGNHRLQAMKKLGAKSITALLVPEPEVAFKILALNTEKAHNLREKSLEVIRMYKELARLDDATEETYALEFEEPAFITLGLCYEERPRLSGGAYHPVLKRVDQFFKNPLRVAIARRRERAKTLLALDDRIVEQVEVLKAKGLTSPYLKNFVVARVNPMRFRPKDAAPLSFDEAVDRMTKAAAKFNPEKVKMEDVVRSGGAVDETE